MKNKTRITSKLRNSRSDNCSMIFMLHADCVNDLFKHIESNYAGFSTMGQWRDSPSIKKMTNLQIKSHSFSSDSPPPNVLPVYKSFSPPLSLREIGQFKKVIRLLNSKINHFSRKS